MGSTDAMQALLPYFSHLSDSDSWNLGLTEKYKAPLRVGFQPLVYQSYLLRSSHFTIKNLRLKHLVPALPVSLNQLTPVFSTTLFSKSGPYTLAQVSPTYGALFEDTM